MEQLTDQELVRLAQQDQQMFGVLFDRYYQPLLRYALKRTGEISVAQDITSETFFRALRFLHRFQWKNIPFSAWLYKIATNEINRYYRRGKVIMVSLESLIENVEPDLSGEKFLKTEAQAVQNTIENAHKLTQVRSVVATLPKKYQDVLSLRFFADKSTTEIAAVLNKKEGTVRSLISRGLEKIRFKLDC